MLLAMLAATAAAPGPPYLVGQAIDAGIQSGDVGALRLVVAAFLLTAIVYWGATYAETYLVGWVGQRALQDLRQRIFAHLQAMSIGFFTRRRPGVLISRLTNDVSALDSLVTDGIVTLFSSTLTLLGVVVILLLLDVQLALITFLTFPLLAIASIVFRIVAANAYRVTREKIANITAHLQETLSGRWAVRSFAQEPRHVQRMDVLNEENYDANLRTVYLNAAYFPAVELLSAVGTAVIILYGGYQAVEGAIAIGVVVAFIGYLQTFFDLIQQISQLYTTYQQGMAALDKIFDLLDTEPEMVDREDALDPGRLARRDRARGRVVFSYTGDEAVGRGLGPATPDPSSARRPWRSSARRARASRRSRSSWRGSTTRSGDVLVDGHDVRDLRSSCLRGQLGIVPQEGFLFSGTVRENIAFGARTRPTRRSGRRRPPSAPTSSSRHCPTATRPRSSAASTCLPASASSSRSHARCSPSRGS